jgi:hypothetical protein
MTPSAVAFVCFVMIAALIASTENSTNTILNDILMNEKIFLPVKMHDDDDEDGEREVTVSTVVPTTAADVAPAATTALLPVAAAAVGEDEVMVIDSANEDAVLILCRQ